jgi:hypothetical protein
MDLCPACLDCSLEFGITQLFQEKLGFGINVAFKLFLNGGRKVVRRVVSPLPESLAKPR